MNRGSGAKIAQGSVEVGEPYPTASITAKRVITRTVRRAPCDLPSNHHRQAQSHKEHKEHKDETMSTHLRKILQHALCPTVFAAEQNADEGLGLVQSRLNRVDVPFGRSAFT